MHPTRSTRRAFLRRAGSTVLVVSGVGAVVAGCTDDDGSAGNDRSSPDAAATTDDSPDEAAAARALRDTTRLAATYDAVLPKYPDLRPTLRPLRADLQEHIDVLSGALGGTGGQRRGAQSVPQSAAAAKQQLAAAEAKAVRRRRQDAIAVESGDLARLLGSMAACHAQHRTLLGRGGKQKEPDAPASVSVDSKALVDAMNETLAGEHAAIYAYGVIGGRLDISSKPVAEATDAIEVHQARRDGLTALVEAGGGTPVAADPGYLLPTDVVNVATARKTAQTVEDRCGVLYATLADTATGEIRAYAVDALIDSATRALEWGAPGSALPGLSGRSS